MLKKTAILVGVDFLYTYVDQHHHHQHQYHDDDQVKDVRVPEQLMRAMAAEAEAAREARAKVIL